ncbi:putative aldouronate transport system permease protein [Anaerocolumna jejuensis DSM 15929]|uniref:Putative aldouronate transport system permease protein n=1 Tax=Anaerocolumna jejuensis DSM 15929 TaxID=1121322 RepID=A0A1M7CD32_9FIRM|nr:carbohydrate ABC transporter permease [Anaerocolumna jejuensis]SHL65152.1 putative aldouronate transport system permease protein [Anaerocolumna jejuensis DSM 15929]
MKSNRIKASFSEQVLQVVIYCILIGLCLMIILPCINIVALSFNDGKDAARGGIYFWTRKFTWDNYKEVIQDGSITKAYFITIARTVIGTVASLIVTSFAAYSLKEKELPGRKLLTILITFTMLFSGGMIPTYIQYNKLGLVDSFWVYVVPSLVSVTYLLMMRTFFETIPESLEESAKLDGCGYFKIFSTIIIPLSKPVMAVVGLYTAVNHWNDWFSGAFYMRSSSLWPVQTVLQQMLSKAMASREVTTVSQAIAQNTNTVTSDSLKMAAVVVTTVPILCVYPFIQKYFAKGAMIGAVKE